MRLVVYVLIFLLLLIAPAQCQQTAEDWLKKGDLLLNSGKYDEAIEAFNRALELNQSYVDAWIHKGVALFSIGNYCSITLILQFLIMPLEFVSGIVLFKLPSNSCSI